MKCFSQETYDFQILGNEALKIQIEKDLNYINTRIKLQSLRALKQYLSEENLTHNRKTATSLRFTEQN